MRTCDLLQPLSHARLRDLAGEVGIADGGDHDDLRRGVQWALHARLRSDQSRPGWQGAGLWVIERLTDDETREALDCEWWSQSLDSLVTTRFAATRAVDALLVEERRFLLGALYLAGGGGMDPTIAEVCRSDTWRACFDERTFDDWPDCDPQPERCG